VSKCVGAASEGKTLLAFTGMVAVLLRLAAPGEEEQAALVPFASLAEKVATATISCRYRPFRSIHRSFATVVFEYTSRTKTS
jgi:hypothetical protein